MKDFRNVGRRADDPSRPGVPIGHATPAASPSAFLGRLKAGPRVETEAATARTPATEVEQTAQQTTPQAAQQAARLAQAVPSLVRKLVGGLLQLGGLGFIAGGVAIMAFQPEEMPAEAAEVVGPIMIFMGVVEYIIGGVIRRKARRG